MRASHSFYSLFSKNWSFLIFLAILDLSFLYAVSCKKKYVNLIQELKSKGLLLRNKYASIVMPSARLLNHVQKIHGGHNIRFTPLLRYRHRKLCSISRLYRHLERVKDFLRLRVCALGREIGQHSREIF